MWHNGDSLQERIETRRRPASGRQSAGLDFRSRHPLADCVFKNIERAEIKGRFRGEICVVGHDERHTVENLCFQNVVRFGKTVTAESPDVTITEYTRNIRFETK